MFSAASRLLLSGQPWEPGFRENYVGNVFICDLEGEPHEVAAPVVAVLLHARGLLDPPVEAQVVTVAQEGTQEVTLLPDTLADPRDGIDIIISSLSPSSPPSSSLSWQYSPHGILHVLEAYGHKERPVNTVNVCFINLYLLGSITLWLLY